MGTIISDLLRRTVLLTAVSVLVAWVAVIFGGTLLLEGATAAEMFGASLAAMIIQSVTWVFLLSLTYMYLDGDITLRRFGFACIPALWFVLWIVGSVIRSDGFGAMALGVLMWGGPAAAYYLSLGLRLKDFRGNRAYAMERTAERLDGRVIDWSKPITDGNTPPGTQP